MMMSEVRDEKYESEIRAEFQAKKKREERRIGLIAYIKTEVERCKESAIDCIQNGYLHNAESYVKDAENYEEQIFELEQQIK